MDFVGRIRGQLDKPERALAIAIDAWRTQRAVRIAELVDALDTSPAFVGTTKAWLAAARTATGAGERGALIRSIIDRGSADIVKTMTVAGTWGDPRLSTQIIALLTRLPFSGTRTREVWRAVFELAAAQRDARFLALAATLPATWNVGPDTKRFLTNRLAEANRDLAAPALRAATDAAIGELIGELARPAKGVVTEASLLDAIYDNPDDDAPRLVYADWLQDKGDPRGEFIALQLQGTPASALLKAHKKAWLGALAPVLGGDVVFRRGFPIAGAVKLRHQRDAEQYGPLRAWATLESLEWTPAGVRDDQREWSRFIHPAMANLRHASGPHPKFVLAATTPWRIEHLEVGHREANAKAFRDLCASPMLPRLRHLTVHGTSDPAWLRGLARCPAELTVRGQSDTFESWLAAARDTPVERFTILYWIIHHTFTRDDTGAFTRLDVIVRPLKYVRSLDTLSRLDEIAKEVRKVPGRKLTHFAAHAEVGGKLVPAPMLEVRR